MFCYKTTRWRVHCVPVCMLQCSHSTVAVYAFSWARRAVVSPMCVKFSWIVCRENVVSKVQLVKMAPTEPRWVKWLIPVTCNKLSTPQWTSCKIIRDWFSLAKKKGIEAEPHNVIKLLQQTKIWKILQNNKKLHEVEEICHVPFRALSKIISRKPFTDWHLQLSSFAYAQGMHFSGVCPTFGLLLYSSSLTVCVWFCSGRERKSWSARCFWSCRYSCK